SNPGQAPAGRNIYRTIVGNPTKYPLILKETSELASSLACGELILSRASDTNTARPFVEQVLQEMVTRPDALDLFSPATLAGQWPQARQALGANFDAHLASLCSQGKMLDYLAEAEFSIDHAALYRLALQKKPAEPLLSASVGRLRDLSKDQWLEGLKEGSELVELVGEVLKSVPDVGIGHALQDALVEIATSVVFGQAVVHLDRPAFDKLLAALSEEQAELVMRHIRDEVIETDADTSALVDVFGTALSNCDLLAERADDLVRRGFRQMLERRITTELSWMASVLEQCPDLLKQAKMASRSDFKERVKELIEEAVSPEGSTDVQRIARVLKLEKK
ncbi:MAG: hypothetical protein ACRD2L_17700, partial [Terriglobia bacterium]